MAYEVDFSYLIREYSSTVIDADNKEQAEDMAYDYVRDTFDGCSDIQIEEVRSI